MTPEQRRIYNKKWHKTRSQDSLDRKARYKRERLQFNMAAIREYKAERGCADCSERDPIVLEFDHLDASLKDLCVAEGHHAGWSLARLMAEVAKCDVVCANCHRRRTHSRRLEEQGLRAQKNRAQSAPPYEQDRQPSTTLDLFSVGV